VQHRILKSQEERNAFSEARPASESLCHIPDTFGIRSRQHHAPELKAEFAFRPASRGGPVAIAANKFHWIVLKMRQAQTFLATFENDDQCHENVGRHLSFGTAHAFGRCLYGPVADERATGGSAHELTLAVGWGPASEANLGGQMLSVDQFLRLVSVPAVFLAFHIATQISGG
jgi:hypothetical protein